MNSAQKGDKPAQEKYCNCRNSKCMKLYCECFAAGIECNRLCRCTDCHNHKDSEGIKLHRIVSGGAGNRALGGQGMKGAKGCSCRKSFCIKKYCECFQEGLLCNQNCKCIECQNNESMTNRTVIRVLKKSNSNASSKLCSLYPIILSPNAEHIQSLINEENSLNLDDKELQEDISELGKLAESGQTQPLVNAFINILKKMDSGVGRQERQQASKESVPE